MSNHYQPLSTPSLATTHSFFLHITMVRISSERRSGCYGHAAEDAEGQRIVAAGHGDAMVI